MKWQNLINRIRGSILALLLLPHLTPMNAVAAQENLDAPLVLKPCWVTNSEETIKSMSASDNESRLLLAKTGSKVESVDLYSGRKIWQTELGGDIISGIFADRNSVFVGTNPVGTAPLAASATTLRSISSETGIVNWTKPVPFSETLYLGGNENTVFLIGSDGTLSAIKKGDGSLIWQNSLGKRLSGVPHFSDRSLVVATEPGEIDIISTFDGSISFQLKTDSVPVSLYLSGERTLIWGDTKGSLAAVDITSKLINWKFKNGGLVSSITGAKESILVTSHDNFVYLMSTGGRVIWKRRMPGRVAEKPVITQNFVILTIVGESGAFFIDLNSGKLLNRVLAEDANYATAAPVAASGLIILSDGDGIHSYSAGNCAPPANEKRGE